MDDRQIRDYVLAELKFEPSIDATHIGVVVDKGIVTLTGHVGSYSERTIAEMAARRVKGVRAIAEEIEVRLPGDKRVADDQIAERALSILRWTRMLPEAAVPVTVQNGVVTLEGHFDWQFQRKAAEDAVRKLSGVVRIVNLITINPRVSAHDVRQKINEALARNAHLEATNIQIEVIGADKVRLEGKVHSWDEREVAERAAWSVPGVRDVEDHLRIG